MKFKLTNNIKDGYREITNFRSEDELKSFTTTHVFRSAEEFFIHSNFKFYNLFLL